MSNKCSLYVNMYAHHNVFILIHMYGKWKSYLRRSLCTCTLLLKCVLSIQAYAINIVDDDDKNQCNGNKLENESYTNKTGANA